MPTILCRETSLVRANDGANRTLVLVARTSASRCEAGDSRDGIIRETLGRIGKARVGSLTSHPTAMRAA